MNKRFSNTIFKFCNSVRVAKLGKMVSRISLYEAKAAKLSNQQIREEFKRLKAGEYNKERINDKILSYLLAMIGEAFFRIYRIRPYKEQYICALAMYLGYIAEMKSGEGKSTVAVITAILYSLDKKVHIVTVNDYLAQRDYDRMIYIYSLFGLSVGINSRGRADKPELYSSDIVYTSSSELIFDYLRNELLPEADRIQFPLEAVIIDEIDFVLLDNANSTFSVSTGIGYVPDDEPFIVAKEICLLLKGVEILKHEEIRDDIEAKEAHYVYCAADRMVYLTRYGVVFLENFFKLKYARQKNLGLYKNIIAMLEANLFFKNGRDYIVKEGKVVLINRENGRLMPDSQLEADLHTAIEVKEEVRVTEKALLCSSLSYQIFFTKYRSMVGMSGTIYDAIEELEKIFNTPIIIIPLHKEEKRVDHPDLFFWNNKEKYDYLTEYLKNRSSQDQPVLVITGSEKQSYEVQKLLDDEGISSNLLNNESTYEEASLVKQAGIHGTITVSTNISGRGTDIILDERARDAGGLLVIALNRYTSRRVDNQVRGRAGRHGDTGECIFYVSMEDELLGHLSGRHKKKMMGLTGGRFGNIDDYTVRVRLSRLLDSIQDDIQADLFRNRQLNYYLDVVLEKQRKIISDWKEKLRGNHINIITRYLKGKEFDLNRFKKVFSYTDHLDVSKEFNSQCERLGRDLSDGLLNKLIDSLVNREWLIYRKNMEDIKAYLPLYRFTEPNLSAEYVRICFSQLKDMQNTVMNYIIAYFISAEIKKE